MARLVGFLAIVLFVACATKGKDGAVSDVEETYTPEINLKAGITRTSGKPRLLGTMAYDCDDGSSVVAQLDAKTGGLWVFLPSGTVLLPHVPAASGTQYSNGSISLRSKGNTAVVEVDGVSRQCVEDRRRSIIADAKLRGNDFWATGNEPGWNLEIGPEFIVLRTSYGQVIYTMHTRTSQVDVATRRTVYDGAVEGVAIHIVIEGTSCSDSMADETYESTVTITVDGQTLHGCGIALH